MCGNVARQQSWTGTSSGFLWLVHRSQNLKNWTNVHLVPCRGGNVNEILYGRNCGMEMMETCESSLKSGTMEQFPFKYPKIFTSVLLHCGTRDIHTIRSSFKSQKCWEWVRFSVLPVSGLCVPAGVNGSQFLRHFGERCFNRFKYIFKTNGPISAHWCLFVIL